MKKYFIFSPKLFEHTKGSTKPKQFAPQHIPTRHETTKLVNHTTPSTLSNKDTYIGGHMHELHLILAALSKTHQNQERIITSLEYLTHWLIQLPDKEADLTAFRIQSTLCELDKSLVPLIESALKLRKIEQKKLDKIKPS